MKNRVLFLSAWALCAVLLLSACALSPSLTDAVEEEPAEEGDVIPMLSVEEAGELFSPFVGEWKSSSSDDRLTINADGTGALNDYEAQVNFLSDVPYYGVTLQLMTANNVYVRIGGIEYFRVDLGYVLLQDGIMTYHRPPGFVKNDDSFLSTLPEDEIVLEPA